MTDVLLGLGGLSLLVSLVCVAVAATGGLRRLERRLGVPPQRWLAPPGAVSLQAGRLRVAAQPGAPIMLYVDDPDGHLCVDSVCVVDVAAALEYVRHLLVAVAVASGPSGDGSAEEQRHIAPADRAP